MVDIHTHILPHLDDGAKDTDTSVAMLQAEVAQGVSTVVLTSHYYGRKRSPRQFLERREGAFAEIQDKIPEGLSVRLGAEVHFTGVNVASFEELALLAVEGTKCILIEFPFTTVWAGALLHKLAEFIADTGYTPIIAHVERYEAVRKNPALVSRLIEMGCLIQVNTTAFLNKQEKGLAFALLKHGFVHCLGSDAHNVEERAPTNDEAKLAIEKAGYLAAWNRAQEIMERVLRGEQVRVERGKPVKKFLGKYF